MIGELVTDRIIYFFIGIFLTLYACYILASSITVWYRIRQAPDWDCEVMRVIDALNIVQATIILTGFYIPLILLWASRILHPDKQIDPNMYGWLFVQGGMLKFLSKLNRLSLRHVEYLESNKSLCAKKIDRARKEWAKQDVGPC